MTKQPSHRIFQECTGPCILQLNVEGLTRSKCEVIEQLAAKHSAQVLSTRPIPRRTKRLRSTATTVQLQFTPNIME